MNREELFASIVAARPDRDNTVYLERRGDVYGWHIVPVGEAVIDSSPTTIAGPDVWMSLSADWPIDEPARMRAFFDDLLAELESMADKADRCRWPINEPWPHVH
jgi:hypothetical protein